MIILLKVVRTTDAWVTTRGTNTGVMKYVGETLQSIATDHKIVCIGIAPWNFQKNYDNIVELNERNSCLEHNHTHFLLVDLDSRTKIETKISEFRSKVENSIRTLHYSGK